MSGAVDHLLGKLPNARRSGRGWSARCPAHDDRQSSLSITEGDDGRVLLKCFAGCEVERIVDALGLQMADLFERRNGLGQRGGGGRYIPPKTAATLQRSAGCTLTEYAEAKHLTPAFLRSIGLSDFSYLGEAAVRIPYLDESGVEIAVRFRIALRGDDRFRWKRGTKPQLYGLNRLHRARDVGYVTMVEGESDVQTLWHYDEPSIGIPGASLYRDDRDAARFDDVGMIFVVHEPDKGGETLLQRLSTSRLRDRVRLITLTEWNVKDPSELHCIDPESFRTRWAAAKGSSEPLNAVLLRRAQERRRRLAAEAEALAREPDILARFERELRGLRVAGEARSAKLLYLAITSRLLSKPVSIAVKGPSSGGKSFLVEQVLSFFPPEAAYALSAMSERDLAYSEEPLVHRVLVLYEAAGLNSDFASYLMRSLLSEGRIRYETVEKTRDGLRSRLIEREGPTSLLVTTTAVRLHPENETRLLSLHVNDTPEQTREVLRALASEAGPDVDLTPWHALQGWLAAGEEVVVVPYAMDLAEFIPPVAIRLRRDFSAILSLIMSHALLHQETRERDGLGRVIATLVDYEAVRELVSDLVGEGVEASVAPGVREVVAAVKALADEGGSEPPSNAEIGRFLKIDRSTAQRRVEVAVDRGYLRNLEERKGRRARLVLGEPLPEETDLLPTLGEGCSVAVETVGYSNPPPPYGGEDEKSWKEV